MEETLPVGCPACSWTGMIDMGDVQPFQVQCACVTQPERRTPKPE